jgi:hypothetical protein
MVGTVSKVRNKQKNNLVKKLIFCWHLESLCLKSRIWIRAGFVFQCMDPRIRIRIKNVTDPEHGSGVRLLSAHGKALTIPVLKFLTHLKGLSHEMDLAFDDMYG